MTTRGTDGYEALTEREKQTLRLIVRGHDAKSIARHFDLSVHTINERLRDARRKLAVSSSREAARLLLDREGQDPDSIGDKQIGEVASTTAAQHGGRNRTQAAIRTGIGVAVVSILLGTLALVMMPQDASAPGAPAETTAHDAAVEQAARDWLALVEQGRWDDSWEATGSAFRKLNTRQVWADVSKRVRPPLGALVSRTLISQEELPAPPRGYQVVKFRTSFVNKVDAVETVSLEREAGSWRVVGITIE